MIIIEHLPLFVHYYWIDQTCFLKLSMKIEPDGFKDNGNAYWIKKWSSYFKPNENFVITFNLVTSKN